MVFWRSWPYLMTLSFWYRHNVDAMEGPQCSRRSTAMRSLHALPVKADTKRSARIEISGVCSDGLCHERSMSLWLLLHRCRIVVRKHNLEGKDVSYKINTSSHVVEPIRRVHCHSVSRKTSPIERLVFAWMKPFANHQQNVGAKQVLKY